MEAAQELQVVVQETRDVDKAEGQHLEDTGGAPVRLTTRLPARSRCKWWFLVTLYTLLILAGQSTATLLGRLYFTHGGASKWTFTFFQLAGFPVLVVYFFIPLKRGTNPTNTTRAKSFTVMSIYVSLGLLIAGVAFLSSLGLSCLPASTVALISASQLAFNAFFSYFLNKEKLTPFTFNSLFLLTLSSILLVFGGDSPSPEGVSKEKYILGFISTLGSSAAYGLSLSLTQFAFWRVIKNDSFSAVVDMNFYQSMVAALCILVGLFATGEWKGFTEEMRSFKLGKVSYVMTLVWSSLAWQVASIGGLGLIFEVSALFSNAVAVLGLPIVPVLAAIFFHEKMDGIKAISLVLAVWGFISHAYQTYLDEKEMKIAAADAADAGEVPKDS